MKVVKRQKNERSWLIDVISYINEFVGKNDFKIKNAGGEDTILAEETMFPDLILYGDKKQVMALQGWEAKMPDVSIDNLEFIEDAQRKAESLKLNSCVLWNFKYAVLYIKENGKFTIKKQWSENSSKIVSRADVRKYESDWKKTLEKVIVEVNDFLLAGKINQNSLIDYIPKEAISSIIEKNKSLVAEKLEYSCNRNAEINAYLDEWWNSAKIEYSQDENDKYQAYSKVVILKWLIRILFAHLIKRMQNAAMAVDKLNYQTTPEEANEIFRKITAKCDFFNVFDRVEFDTILPIETWNDIISYSIFISKSCINEVDQEMLQNVLENTVDVGKRELDGQYTTPVVLARMLVRMTIKDYTKNFLDFCCGTGTIANQALTLKTEKIGATDAVKTTFACDKYPLPLQVANVSLANVKTIRKASRLFQHNALNLKVNECIKIVNPESGKKMDVSVPKFDSIASNLPFIPFENISEEDKELIKKGKYGTGLDAKCDEYCYLMMKAAELVEENGTLGFICSNSWLGTKSGKTLVQELQKKFSIKQVHISGNGRWFKNADVVTTILILTKKQEKSGKIKFYLWNTNLEQITSDKSIEDKIVNSSILGKDLNSEYVTITEYSFDSVQELIDMNVSYNSLFHDVEWLLNLKDKIIQIQNVFDVFRGCRRGWDPMFFPEKGHGIEARFIKRVLINARNVDSLIATADRDAFCCGLSMTDLKKEKCTGALNWINTFVNQVNKKGVKLVKCLAKNGCLWYELKTKEIAEFFTMMNPDKRFFFSRFKKPSFVNQRLIGLNAKDEFPNKDLNHALLNSIFTIFYIEASGFGRGLGVLDIRAENIKNCFMLNPSLVGRKDEKEILKAFSKLLERPIKNIADELEMPDRLNFEHVVLKAFGIDSYFNKIKKSLISMQQVRATVKKKEEKEEEEEEI